MADDGNQEKFHVGTILNDKFFSIKAGLFELEESGERDRSPRFIYPDELSGVLDDLEEEVNRYDPDLGREFDTRQTIISLIDLLLDKEVFSSPVCIFEYMWDIIFCLVETCHINRDVLSVEEVADLYRRFIRIPEGQKCNLDNIMSKEAKFGFDFWEFTSSVKRDVPDILRRKEVWRQWRQYADPDNGEPTYTGWSPEEVMVDIFGISKLTVDMTYNERRLLLGNNPEIITILHPILVQGLH